MTEDTKTLVETIAREIWISDGGVPRIWDEEAYRIDERAARGSRLYQTVKVCYRHAEAAVAPLAAALLRVEGELETLRAKLAEGLPSSVHVNQSGNLNISRVDLAAVCDRASEAEARTEAMRMALEPFASVDPDPTWPDDAALVMLGRIGGDAGIVSVGHLRAARKALGDRASVGVMGVSQGAEQAAVCPGRPDGPSPAGWRDIASAPRDGTLVVLLSAYSEAENHWPAEGEDKIIRHYPRAHLGKWDPEGTSWVDQYGRLDGDAYQLAQTGVWTSGAGWFEPNEVTHWMPLPPAPAKESEQVQKLHELAPAPAPARSEQAEGEA